MADIYLITCVKKKRQEDSPASELYTSSLFRKLKALAEKKSDAWFILSARYGLVKPSQVIAPYELTLSTMPKRERAEWAEKLMRQLEEEISPGDKVTILAGRRYWEGLVPVLEASGYEVSTPLKGISLFYWHPWLDRELADDSGE